MSEANDFLFSGGSGDKHPTAAFPTIGTKVGGPIVAIASKPIQQREFGTNEPLTYSDGSPRLMLPVEIQTADQDGPDDDGIRVLFLKYKLRDAVADAVKASGAAGLEVGGHLTVTHTGVDGQAKLYSATYAAPNASAEFLGTGSTVTATLGNAGPVAQSTTEGEIDPVGTAKSLIGLGQTDEVIASVTGLQPNVIAAIRNTVAA